MADLRTFSTAEEAAEHILTKGPSGEIQDGHGNGTRFGNLFITAISGGGIDEDILNIQADADFRYFAFELTVCLRDANWPVQISIQKVYLSFLRSANLPIDAQILVENKVVSGSSGKSFPVLTIDADSPNYNVTLKINYPGDAAQVYTWINSYVNSNYNISVPNAQ